MKTSRLKLLLVVGCALMLINCCRAKPPAGVIPYSCLDGDVYVLLAYDGEWGREAWASFGGTANSDEEIHQTAAREFHEETGRVFSVPSALRLKNKKVSKSGGFYTYAAQVPYVSPKVIEESNRGVKDKRRDWIWVGLPALVRAVENKENVKGADGKEYPLWERSRQSLLKAIQEGLLPKNNDVCKK